MMQRLVLVVLLFAGLENEVKGQFWLPPCYVHFDDPSITQACMKQINTTCLNDELVWTMFDASSKILTSGMTYSNVIDMGNYPECMTIKHRDKDGEILGKYCALSVIIVNILITTESKEILTNFGLDINTDKAIEISEDDFKSLQDILIPTVPIVISKYSSCVPDACTPAEVGTYFGFDKLQITINNTTIPLIIYPGLACETVNSNTNYEAGDIVMITFFSLIVLLMLASTIYDALLQNFRKPPYHPLLLSFSILYNGKKLLYISTNTTDQIQVFNGMRFISMMWVVAFHAVSVYEGGVISLENFPEVQNWNKMISNRYILSGLLAVDTFFYISGFLLAFSYIKSNQDENLIEQVKKVPKMYLHRYLRLTPAVGMMFLVTITFYRFMGAGPIWTTLTDVLKTTCKEKWWKFFLYIQNYTDPDEMCINPMWYLSADMQMFILAPLVLIPASLFIKKKFKLTMIGLGCVTCLSILIPMLVRYFGDKSAGNIYTAHERFNNFLIGIMFGAYMRMYKHKPFIFNKYVNVLLWILVLCVSLAFNLYWFDVLNYYNLLKYTLFMGFYRPVWCLGLVFMTYSCYHNHGGVIQWFLSANFFQILGRLSYSMYVLHVIVQLYALGTITIGTVYFSNYFLFYNWCGHIIATMMVAVFWVLAFEFPMLTIDKYLLGDERKKAKPEADKI